ncbi:hypothetical protein [Aequorivita sp. KMM 9714]|uniref:hypothetical protein n=1 Tax=Aequorivita sp. KMM 9714 TaxID=2707173 RepID=UPI0013EA83BC|nr:hypothetical protein [Aequorivita sp. KMM 9714]NGX82950.1 hypothetical protein [Aequorivita sp. KMM 9714]
MKKYLLILTLSLVFFSCKNSEENKTSDELTTQNEESLPTFQGDFINTDGALVLMGSSFIYGVKRNEVSDELSKRVSAIKTNDFDMVGVIVKGVVSENTDTDTNWEEIITIKEIVKVNDSPSAVDIKLQESAKTN